MHCYGTVGRPTIAPSPLVQTVTSFRQPVIGRFLCMQLTYNGVRPSNDGPYTPHRQRQRGLSRLERRLSFFHLGHLMVIDLPNTSGDQTDWSHTRSSLRASRSHVTETDQTARAFCLRLMTVRSFLSLEPKRRPKDVFGLAGSSSIGRRCLTTQPNIPLLIRHI